MKVCFAKNAGQLILMTFFVVFLIILVASSAYVHGEENSNKPEITSVVLDKTEVSEGTKLTMTVRAESNSPVNWLHGNFFGPHGNIWGGGSGYSGMFTEISPGLWEYIRHDIVSKYAPRGNYYYQNIAVKNEGKLESNIWPGELNVYIENDSDPQPPVIKDVKLDIKEIAEGTELTLTVTAESNSPVNEINRNFYGPAGYIYSGGIRAPGLFDEVEPRLWEYTRHDIVSKYAPSGEYYYENISVGNAGMLESNIWPGELSVYIENDIDPEPPVIKSVTLDSKEVAKGTRLELTVLAESNSPVVWFNGSFYGPSGNIWGGGYGSPRLFDEVEPGLWEYTRVDNISHHSPSGNYYYQDIAVRNEGMLESDVWPGELIVNIETDIDPEEKEVKPKKGSATVEFPESDVVIVIETKETGTITVTRYPSDNRAPPSGKIAAGIYLDIEPSGNLQGKPITFTVNYNLPLPGGMGEDALKLYRWSGTKWELLPNQVVDTDEQTITVQLYGFSIFGVFADAPIELPEQLDVEKDQMWRINFNREFTKDEIEDIYIDDVMLFSTMTDGTEKFVNVEVEWLPEEKQAIITPIEDYQPGEAYHLIIILSNDNHYRMKFTVAAEYAGLKWQQTFMSPWQYFSL